MSDSDDDTVVEQIRGLLDPVLHTRIELTAAQAEMLTVNPELVDAAAVFGWLAGVLIDTSDRETVAFTRAQVIVLTALAENASHRDQVVDAMDCVLDEVGAALTGGGTPLAGALPEIARRVADRAGVAAP